MTEFPTQKDEQVSKLDEQYMVLIVVPLQIIIPVDIPKIIANNTEIKKGNTPKGKTVKSKFVKKTSLKRKLVHSSDSERDVKECVHDIVHAIRTKVDGKIIPVNIPSAPMDNVSFQSKISV